MMNLFKVANVLGILGTLLLSGCEGPQEQSGASQLNNVFGTDDRQAITSQDSPWRMIGYIDGCTGTLVGRDLVLTAAHCVIDPATNALRSNIGKFQPNRIEGVSNEESAVQWVWWGTTTPDADRKNDWAVLRLEQPLGDIYGWMGTKSVDIASSLPYRITLAGYSGDFQSQNTAGTHIGCHIRESFSSGIHLHDCDATRGSSGGPIFSMFDGQPYIVALNVAEYRDGGEDSLYLADYERDRANIAIWQRAIADKIAEVGSTARPNYISIFATPNASYYGWGRAPTEAAADDLARGGCGNGECVKVTAGPGLCAALVKQNGDNGGWNWATRVGLKGATKVATTACESYAGAGQCTARMEVCAGLQ